jgi:hypothetical protein
MKLNGKLTIICLPGHGVVTATAQFLDRLGVKYTDTHNEDTKETTFLGEGFEIIVDTSWINPS